MGDNAEAGDIEQEGKKSQTGCQKKGWIKVK
jgi:hypothetical protein